MRNDHGGLRYCVVLFMSRKKQVGLLGSRVGCSTSTKKMHGMQYPAKGKK